MLPKTIKIGTRASPLALKQAEEAKKAIEGAQEIQVELVPMTTTGDKRTDVQLAEIGGKGLFTKEIEEALQQGKIDLAVHSMKDVETWLQPDYCIPCMLKREDPRDSWLSIQGRTLENLPPGSRVGTSSIRRVAQILHMRPDLRIVPFRGNVDTRLSKLQAQEVDATLLAVAGLNRLKRNEVQYTILEPDVMIPAVGQGALGLECLASRHDIVDLLKSVNHQPTHLCVSLERAFLEEIDGTCGTPVGTLATLANGSDIKFIACVASPDGKHLNRRLLQCPIRSAENEIRQLGKLMHQWLKDHQ
jgi:hydroxymethylbilane synthase